MGNYNNYSSFLLKQASTELTLFVTRTVTDLGLRDGGWATGRSRGPDPSGWPGLRDPPPEKC